MLRLCASMKLSSCHSASRRRQSGYVLLIILLMLVLLMIGLLKIAPTISTQIKRDKEEEMIHRGTQYAIAIKRYYKKFGRYPNRLEDLENTNNIRFLRKRYKNPTDPQGNWRILHMGDVTTEVNVPGLPGANPVGTPAGALGTNPQQPPAVSVGTQGGPMGGPQAAPGTTTGGPQTFGGGPIVGVAGTVDKTAIMAWHRRTSYKEWEFFYDPRLDVSLTGVNPGAAGGAGQGGSTGPMPPQKGPK